MARFIPSHRRMQIVLVGLLHDTNLGDPAIFQATQYTVQNYCQKRRVEVSLGLIDIGRYRITGYRCHTLNRLYEKVRNKLWRLLFRRSFTVYDRVRLACRQTIKKSTAAVIFVGGSLIKFKQQEYLHQMLEIVLCRAEQMNVPVMFSGVGVEGFDGSSEICRRLQASLNRKCVQVITVRDDIKTLQTFYLSAARCIRTAKVSDAACSLNALYPPAVRKKNTVGLGVIRGGIFAEYGSPVSEDELLKLYAGLYHQIVKSGRKCLIFSNGTYLDQRFAERLAQRVSAQGSPAEILCPRPQTVAELVNNITQCEGIIATRLHAGIIAFAYGIPFVGLVWNPKQRFFGESIGIQDRFFDVSAFDAERIVNKLLDAIAAGYPDAMLAYKQSNAEELEKFLSEHIG